MSGHPIDEAIEALAPLAWFCEIWDRKRRLHMPQKDDDVIYQIRDGEETADLALGHLRLARRAFELLTKVRLAKGTVTASSSQASLIGEVCSMRRTVEDLLVVLKEAVVILGDSTDAAMKVGLDSWLVAARDAIEKAEEAR